MSLINRNLMLEDAGCGMSSARILFRIAMSTPPLDLLTLVGSPFFLYKL